MPNLEPDDPFDRGDLERRAKRDLERRSRRDEGHFWNALALVGSVGWPIVLLATGGALLGHVLDARWDTGVRLTLTLLAIGVTMGTWAAFRAARGDA